MPYEAWLALVGVAIVFLGLLWLALKNQRESSAKVGTKPAARIGSRKPGGDRGGEDVGPAAGIGPGKTPAAQKPQESMATRLSTIGGTLAAIVLAVTIRGQGFSLALVAVAGIAAGAAAAVGFMIGWMIDKVRQTGGRG